MVLRISPQQMQAMHERRAEPQVDALFDHVQDRLGLTHPIQPQHGREVLTAAVLTARRHGLSDPAALERYALLVVRVGDDLGYGPADAWSGPILDDPWLSDAEKISLLEQAAIERGLLSHPV
ncbi:hypothetical protein [Paraliomyxa miuraensis]|uniref:hypothetical protein n=1 Tax=Paraliomyxa miuraensis TaxID=376150 RepID=UPI00224FB310|nr:hypothetical protein [Paraliomyxa miuraensis]MCX4244914.1 hypothetical protein [Paraliomyxa miuraensis]